MTLVQIVANERKLTKRRIKYAESKNQQRRQKTISANG